MAFEDGEIELHLSLGPRIADGQLAGDPGEPFTDELARIFR